jgi:predicted transcriptional regulator
MARPKTRGLTENELVLMRILWEKAPLTVADIVDKIERRPKPAYNSVLTLLRILEQKGHVRHRKEGKAFLYSPVLEGAKYRMTELKRLVSGLFQGNALECAVHLVKSETLTSEDRRTLKRLLEEL